MLARTLQRMFPFKNQSFKTMGFFHFEADVGKYAKNDVFMHHQKYEILKDINKTRYYFSEQKQKKEEEKPKQNIWSILYNRVMANIKKTLAFLVILIGGICSDLAKQNLRQIKRWWFEDRQIFKKAQQIKLDHDYLLKNNLTELKKIIQGKQKKKILYITSSQGEGKSVAVKKVLKQLQQSKDQKKVVLYLNYEDYMNQNQNFLKTISILCKYLKNQNKNEKDRTKAQDTFIVIDSLNKIITGQPASKNEETKKLSQIVQLLYNGMCKSGYNIIFMVEQKTFLEEHLEIDGIKSDKYKKLYISEMSQAILRNYLQIFHTGNQYLKLESPPPKINDEIIDLIVKNHSSHREIKEVARQYLSKSNTEEERIAKAKERNLEIIKRQRQNIQSVVNAASEKAVVEQILLEACFSHKHKKYPFSIKTTQVKESLSFQTEEQITKREKVWREVKNNLKIKNIILGNGFQTLSLAKAMTERFREKYQRQAYYKNLINDQEKYLQKSIDEVECNFTRHEYFISQGERVDDFRFVGVF